MLVTHSNMFNINFGDSKTLKSKINFENNIAGSVNRK